MVKRTKKISKENWEKFKIIQSKVNINNSIMIKTDDQSVYDDVHHNNVSNIIIGDRFFEAYKQLVEVL